MDESGSWNLFDLLNDKSPAEARPMPERGEVSAVSSAHEWSVSKLCGSVKDRVTQSPTELCVMLDIPEKARKQIHGWVLEQEWPEGTELHEPEEYHITLMYTPDGYEEHKGADWIEHMDSAKIRVTGIDSFTQNPEGQYPYVLRIDAPEVKERAQEMQDRAEDHGLEITHFPGGYKPHITVGYGPKKGLDTEVLPLEFEAGPSKVSPPRDEKTSSRAPIPPGLKDASGKDRCGNCKMFDKVTEECWGYGNRGKDDEPPVTEYSVCDSYDPAPGYHQAAGLKNWEWGARDDRRVTEPDYNAFLDQARNTPHGDLSQFCDDQECYELAEMLNRKKRFPIDAGFYNHPQRGYGDHGWNRLPDGTIIDTTAIQHGPGHPIVIPPDHPYYPRYVSWVNNEDEAQRAAHGLGYHDGDMPEDNPACPACNTRQTKVVAATYGEAQLLDDLSMRSVAHNLHYKFRDGARDPAVLKSYAERLLEMIGYPPEDMNTVAALQAWQTLYPQDQVALDAPKPAGELQAPPTTPSESWGYGTTSGLRRPDLVELAHARQHGSDHNRAAHGSANAGSNELRGVLWRHGQLDPGGQGLLAPAGRGGEPADALPGSVPAGAPGGPEDGVGLLAGSRTARRGSTGWVSPELDGILDAFNRQYGATVLADESPAKVSFNHIEIPPENRGGGVGHRMMNQLRAYVDRHGKGLQVDQVVNYPFFAQFPWLQPAGPDTFVYTGQSHGLPADNGSTEPTAVNNPEDHWPDFGGVGDGPRDYDAVQFGNDW